MVPWQERLKKCDYKKKKIERHSTCMMRSEKMAMEDGRIFFFFFWVSEFWQILTQK
jgi:hypothetical protein